MLNLLHDLVERYASSTAKNPVCARWESTERCDSLTLGCLIQTLSRAKLWPLRSDPSAIDTSVTNLRDSFTTLPIVQIPGAYQHEHCEFQATLEKDMRCLYDAAEPSGLLDSHRKHMEDQGMKLRVLFLTDNRLIVD